MKTSPYIEIPDYPKMFNVGTVLSRMIDGLGFRYHWATEGLSTENLEFKPEQSCRNTMETLNHIQNVLVMVNNIFSDTRFIMPEVDYALDFEELREKSLALISEISNNLKSKTDDDLQSMQIKFNVGGQDLDFPFWHVVNGPISDAIYHTGQIVALRRASENPIDTHVNPFMGKRMAA